ncbi:hypothetical protein QQ045_000513 [Rhodiola kirilowii]
MVEDCNEGYYFNPTIEIINDTFPFRDPHGGLENDYFAKDAYDKYQRLLAEAQAPIYEGSENTILDTILKAMTVKVDNGWSDKSFNDHLKLTKDLLPRGNNYSDSEAWQDFDKNFPNFAKEIRNVRLGLATDGFNPFGAAALSHSTWPIVVMPYNLPPFLCMKKEFNILAMLISGPKSPGKCLNVFMQPLIDELNMLWDTGVLTYDRHDGSSFHMKAAVLWTISDFPGLGMLGGLK